MSTDDQCVSESIHVPAAPADVFALLSDPSQHHRFDGSGMVHSSRGGSTTVELGSKFGMNMKLGPIPYRVNNTVVEFENNKLIAWAHIGGHRWRYQIEPDGDGSLVTESFDWSTAKVPKFLELMNYPSRNRQSIVNTLQRLRDLFKDQSDV